MILADKLSRHIRDLTPHVQERETVRLLTEARDEILRLEQIIREEKSHATITAGTGITNTYP